VTTWILRHPIPTDAVLRVAVKDLIDVVGEATTAGSRAVERRARPAIYTQTTKKRKQKQDR
jgi:Asp-tRNA(Asn)/Glu-tRNA(Gln) amidotransferase A subunit family amidase